MAAALRLSSLGLKLPKYQVAVGTYRKAIIEGNLLYTSTHVGMDAEGNSIKGLVGDANDYSGALPVYTAEEAHGFARNSGLPLLSTLSHVLDGDLDRVEQIIKMRGLVNGTVDFTGHGAVINGCSDVLAEVLGEEKGVGVRTCSGGAPSGGAAVQVDRCK